MAEPFDKTDPVSNTDLTGLAEEAFPDAPQVEIDMADWFAPTPEDWARHTAEQR